MSYLRLLVCVLALSLALPVSSQAATLFQDYGRGSPGLIDPLGNDPLGRNAVLVSEQSTDPFLGVFDFTDLSFSSIQSVTLTLDFNGFRGSDEDWDLQIFGSDSNSITDDIFISLGDLRSDRNSIVISATSAGDAFSTLLSSSIFTFGFVDTNAAGADRFGLENAELSITGQVSAAIPLPASGLLLIGAIAGVGALRRRRKAA